MKISVILPVYNCEDYLEVNLKSVLYQTYSNWELIIIDDGSTDDTFLICKQYAQMDNRIKVIHSENLGPANARNIGIANSSGDYCLFIDSDDYIELEALETLREIVQSEQPDIVFYPNFTDKFENGNYKVIKKNVLMKLSFKSNQEFIRKYRYLSENGYIHPVWNKLYRKKFIEECKSFFPKGVNVSEDYIFNLKLYKKLTKAALIDKPLYHYVSRNQGSITSSFNSNRFNSSKEVYLYAIETFKTWNMEELNNVKNAFITDLNVSINNLYNRDCKWKIKEKHEYIENIVIDSSVIDCIDTTNIEGIRNKITAFLIKKRFVSLLMMMGKITRVVGEAKAKWKVP